MAKYRSVLPQFFTDFIGFEQTLYEVSEGESDVEVCVISKGPPFLSPLTVTMATVSGRQGSYIMLHYKIVMPLTTFFFILDADFLPSTSDMTFIGDQKKVCARVQIVNDVVAEKVEYFHVFLFPKLGVRINPNIASVQITDNDGEWCRVCVCSALQVSCPIVLGEE